MRKIAKIVTATCIAAVLVLGASACSSGSSSSSGSASEASSASSASASSSSSSSTASSSASAGSSSSASSSSSSSTQTKNASIISNMDTYAYQHGYGIRIASTTTIDKDGEHIIRVSMLNQDADTMKSYTLYVLGEKSDGSLVQLTEDLPMAEVSTTGAAAYIQKYESASAVQTGQSAYIDFVATSSDIIDAKCIGVTYSVLNGINMDNEESVQQWISAAEQAE